MISLANHVLRGISEAILRMNGVPQIHVSDHRDRRISLYSVFS